MTSGDTERAQGVVWWTTGGSVWQCVSMATGPELERAQGVVWWTSGGSAWQCVSMATGPELDREPARVRLGRIISEQRNYHRLTQAQLSNNAGIATNTVVKLERGDRVKDRSLWAIELAFGWPKGTTDYILAGGDPPDPHPERGDIKTKAREIRRALADLDERIQLLLESFNNDL